MKVQVRQNVFETNSSSVHTLSICTKSVDDDILKMYAGTTLTLGLPWDKREKGNHFQDRLDNLFDYMTYGDSLSHFFQCKYKIEKVLSKYEIKCNYLISETGEYDNYSGTLDVFDNLFGEDDESFEKDLLCFIFNDKSKIDYFNRDYFNESKDLPKENKNFVEWS